MLASLSFGERRSALGRGGAEKLLSEGVHFAGSDFTYAYGYFLPWKDALVPDLKAANAEVFCFSRRNGASILLAANQVARALNQWDADLLHCHLPLAGVAGRFAGRKTRYSTSKPHTGLVAKTKTTARAIFSARLMACSVPPESLPASNTGQISYGAASRLR